MLQAAVEAEVGDYVAQHAGLCDPQTGQRLVVRNGRQPERTIQSSLGDIAVTKPRVHDRREGRRFTSCILPPCMRRTPALEALIPLLYLKGISTNDFPDTILRSAYSADPALRSPLRRAKKRATQCGAESSLRLRRPEAPLRSTSALAAILGPDAAGLSPSTICRLKEVWQGEHQDWAGRDLSAKRYVAYFAEAAAPAAKAGYWWADGVYYRQAIERWLAGDGGR